MATTNLIPIHKGKDGKTAKAITRVIGYVKNPDKTDNGSLVTGYGCNPALADIEFMYMKKQYLDHTGRHRGKDDVIAYHLRQSFPPGEIEPDEANRLGQELARRFTHGFNAFIVATHIDRHHVHNHIVISAVNLSCDRKFRNFWGSTKALGRLSDIICLENGYSVIEHPKKRSKPYNKWLEDHPDEKRPTQRDSLRAAIDAILSKRPKDLGELLSALQAAGWEVKTGKHIAVRGVNQARYKRLDSLGDGYSQNDLIRRITDLSIIEKEKTSDTASSEESAAGSIQQNVNLLIDIQNRMREAKGAGYERWAKSFNLKEMAKTFSYLREHDLLDRDELDRRASEASRISESALTRIRQIDARQREIRALRGHIIQYAKTRDVYAQYRKSNWSPKYASQHSQEIADHKAAKRAFDALGIRKLPRITDLNSEYEKLQEEKDRLYASYKRDRAEMRQLLIVQENVRRILDDTPDHHGDHTQKQLLS